MQTIELEQATIRVAKVFDLKTGRRRGTLKDANGVLWSPWAKDMATYVEGRDYTVEFEINENGGVAYRNIESGRVLAAKSEPQRSSSTVSNGHSIGTRKMNDQQFYRPTSPRDAERMFVCSTLNAFIQTGRVDQDVTALTNYVETLRQVWRDTFGQDDQELGAG